MGSDTDALTEGQEAELEALSGPTEDEGDATTEGQEAELDALTSSQPATQMGQSSGVPVQPSDEFEENFDEQVTKTVKILGGLLGEKEVEDLTDASKAVKFKNFLTGRDDATIFNVSFMSRPAEWHAVAIGIFIALGFAGLMVDGISGDPYTTVSSASSLVAGISVALGRVWGKLSKGPGQVQDALEEPAYVVGGFLLGGGIRFVMKLLGNVGLF